MPHRRKSDKGSFGGHFDELVKHFPEQRREERHNEKADRSKEERGVRDRLFKHAWRKQQPSRDAPH